MKEKKDIIIQNTEKSDKVAFKDYIKQLNLDNITIIENKDIDTSSSKSGLNKLLNDISANKVDVIILNTPLYKKRHYNLAKCEICKKEMSTSDGCSMNKIKVNGNLYNRIKVGAKHDMYDNRTDKQIKCHDCGAKNGNYHHWNCDAERCPVCYGQLLTCECEDVYYEVFKSIEDALKYEKEQMMSKNF